MANGHGSGTGAKKTEARKPSSLLDTRVIYCGDNLEQLKKLRDACIDLIYIDPPLTPIEICSVLGIQSVKDGRPMHDNNILSRFIKPVGRNCGLPFVNWRCLRTSDPTWLKMAGADVKDAQA
jgi:hypothetical protein